MAEVISNVISDIDDEFVDVHFPDDPKYVFGDLGARCMERVGAYDKVENIITDRKKWEEITEKRVAEGHKGLPGLVKWILNQKNEGSCVGFAGTAMMQLLSALVLGLDNAIQFSGTSLYKQIGRSPGSGAMVSDCLDALIEVGLLPLDTPENRAKYGNAVMPANGFHTPWPADWKNTAKRFRAVEFYTINSVEALVTALLYGHPVQVGREGHSILYLGIVFKNGKMYILYVNSWGEWGQGAGDHSYGFGLDTESQLRKSANWAFSARTATFDPNVISVG